MHTETVSAVAARLANCPPADLPSLLATLSDDGRPGVVVAAARARSRLTRFESERARQELLGVAEAELIDAGFAVVAGVDEVGRGALAGPVSAGACVFARDTLVLGLNDSKVLSPSARARLHETIAASAIAVSVGHADATEIDTVGIVEATILAMRRALDGLGVVVDHVLVDGRPVDLGLPTTAVVRGDSKVRAIAAAAIAAKVTRDALMAELDVAYPGYGFAGNKGYGSADHLDALQSLGPSPVHRRSFSPCSQAKLF